MTKNIAPILLMFLLSCQHQKENVNNSSEAIHGEDTSFSKKTNLAKEKTDIGIVESTLQDTIRVKGNTIVILRPDSLRFQSYIENGDEWIYEVDSDFGFGISEALNLFNLKNVNEKTTEKRFIEIEDCNGCPIIIDRDTIDYGVLLTGKNRDLKLDQNIFGQEYYFELFNEYYK